MKKVTVLCGSFLFICLFVLYMTSWKNRRIMGSEIFSDAEIRFLLESKSPLEDGIRAELLINGVGAAYEEKEARYYIPKNMEDGQWKGSLQAAVEGVPASVAWAEDDAFGNMRQAVAEGHVFRCVIYNETGYKWTNVLFTGLPVMSIDGDMGEPGSRVSVFDPVKSFRKDYQVEESSAYYNIRGNASRRFEKIGYRLELFYDDGSAGRDLSLLGMRSDNDWQLKAMYSDRSKLRDKLSIDLWNQIAAGTGTRADDGCRMEYLELIVNGEYRGLYGLVEPTDYKSLELDRSRDLIYKVVMDERPSDSLFDMSEQTQSFSCAGVNIRQSDKTFYPGIWEPFRMLWNNGYETESEEELKLLYNCIDRQNFIEYGLYQNVIAGVDNRFKNIIYSTIVQEDGTYTIRRIPWDQNYSWGDDFEQGENKDDKNIRYNPDILTKWMNEDVFWNMRAYDIELADDIKDTWKNWRSSFLTEEVWKDYTRELMAYLVDSGAFSRDTVRWPDSGNVPATEEIETFIDTRFSWMDEYVSQIEAGRGRF